MFLNGKRAKLDLVMTEADLMLASKIVDENWTDQFGGVGFVFYFLNMYIYNWSVAVVLK